MRKYNYVLYGIIRSLTNEKIRSRYNDRDNPVYKNTLRESLCM